MLDLFDADGRDGGAGERTEQDATERVAQRRPEARIQRLGDEAHVRLGFLFDLDVCGLELVQRFSSIWTYRRRPGHSRLDARLQYGWHHRE